MLLPAWDADVVAISIQGQSKLLMMSGSQFENSQFDRHTPTKQDADQSVWKYGLAAERVSN